MYQIRYAFAAHACVTHEVDFEHIAMRRSDIRCTIPSRVNELTTWPI